MATTDNFQPGNTDPQRYSKRSKLSAAVAALVLAGASAPVILTQFLDEKEAVVLHAYPDGKKIWTACRGLTHVHGVPVTSDMKFTRTECDALDGAELQATLAELERLVAPDVWRGLGEPARAGIASFCTYNIGAPKCRGSTFLKLLNAGQRNRACAEITKWIRDNGRDCRVDKSCRGQPTRRQQEDELCLMGAEDVS